MKYKNKKHKNAVVGYYNFEKQPCQVEIVDHIFECDPVYASFFEKQFGTLVGIPDEVVEPEAEPEAEVEVEPRPPARRPYGKQK